MNENSTGIPLTDLIVARKFDWVNPEITDERFPKPTRLWNDYKEFHFGEMVSSEEAVKRMQAQGYEPTNFHELLRWEGWNEENAVIALGSIAGINGHSAVMYFFRDWRGNRKLYLDWWDGIWNNSCRFLGVCKSAADSKPVAVSKPFHHHQFF